MVSRLLRHLATPAWVVRRAFSAHALRDIEEAVRHSESRHTGEVRVAVEGALSLSDLLKGVSARERAELVFSDLHVWDTQDNNGVLIYVLLADHCVEIVADRGAASRVAPEVWRGICQQMEQEFRAGRARDAMLAGIAATADVLASYFPATGENPNELPDRPTLL